MLLYSDKKFIAQVIDGFVITEAMETLGQRIKRRREELGLDQIELARRAGISQPTLANLERGKNERTKFLSEIARELETTTEWLNSGKGESSLSRDVNIAAGPEIRGLVPLISWVRAGEFCESPDNFHPGDAERWLPCPVPHGPKTYALQVVGRSMDGEDGYREGELIFVDPDQSDPKPNKDFIFRHPDGSSTFKRLKQELDGWYLLALNPEWSPRYIKMPEGSHICGRVIFSARDR